MTRLRILTPLLAVLFLYAPPGFASDALWPRALPVGRWVHADTALELAIERGSVLLFRATQSEMRGEFHSYQQVRNEYWGCFSLTAQSQTPPGDKPTENGVTPEKPGAAETNPPAGESTGRADADAAAQNSAANAPAAADSAAAAATVGETKTPESGPNKSSAPANFNNRPGRDAPPPAPPGPPDLSWITPRACAILVFESNEALVLYAFPDGEKPGPILRFVRAGARRTEANQGP